jgi:S-adenosylmethionine/arginine decarboxylase-like enzyme
MGAQLGWHWIFDGWAVDDHIACDEPLLLRVLEELPKRLELALVARPQVFANPGSPASIAGIVLLAESHFSLHAVPERGVLHGDLFSCKPFELTVARRCLQEFFSFRQLSDQLIDRGTDR